MDQEPKDKSYIVELNGRVNGDSHIIEFDAKNYVRERAEREGRPLTEEVLERETMELLRDIDRTKEVLSRSHNQPPLKGILSRFVKR